MAPFSIPMLLAFFGFRYVALRHHREIMRTNRRLFIAICKLVYPRLLVLLVG